MNLRKLNAESKEKIYEQRLNISDEIINLYTSVQSNDLELARLIRDRYELVKDISFSINCSEVMLKHLLKERYNLELSATPNELVSAIENADENFLYNLRVIKSNILSDPFGYVHSKWDDCYLGDEAKLDEYFNDEWIVLAFNQLDIDPDVCDLFRIYYEYHGIDYNKGMNDE